MVASASVLTITTRFPSAFAPAVTNTDDFLWRLVKGCIQLGLVPDINNTVNMVPVDHVARCCALAAAHPGRVHVLKLVSADQANNAAAAEEIKRVAGRLDVVIANAGISDCFEPALEVPPEEIIRHVEVRLLGWL